ncbi:glutamyl-tRNA reductase [Sporolactobacillus terrae]|uniref:Glutamyl-tRNA reductase n=1 Tax=Sporolactobacillus terrae TaxID=269673 RepID=A0A5K7WX99_9BACL|nr:glutamyl-tRNA reductase [Sporolactobacillus terrae]UAK16822.1 glutamyl-tRNA reductase [Sporolactobacillus terrae]BBN98314.1 glutamyl-tRNA reductase [Sporolactobacillus terrae]
MHILAIGVNHRNTPVEIREKLTFQPEDLERALSELRQTKSIFEDVILSTCNRTELYVVSDQLHTGRYYSKKFFAEWFGISLEALTPYLIIQEDQEAIQHLFRVTCGLESMVLGETQILGQVRESFVHAQQCRTTGTFFNELFKEALTVAKHAQDVTQINDHPVSISYAAVKLIQDYFGPLENKSVVLIGAGEMGTLAQKHLSSSGVRRLTIVNRTKEKADGLAKQAQANSASLESLGEQMKQCDIVFASTSAPGYLITEAQLQPILDQRKRRPLVLVDIGVPRNIDPVTAYMDGVSLFDVDDLDRIVDENRAARRRAAKQIEGFIEQQQGKYSEWLHTLGVVPVISALRRKALAIHSDTMKRIENKLPEMTERERRVVSKQAKSMINQLLRDPINNIKELACHEHGKHAIDHFAEIFNIDGDVPQRGQSEEEEKVTEFRIEKAEHETLKPTTIG